jgi:hypothetical protein
MNPNTDLKPAGPASPISPQNHKLSGRMILSIALMILGTALFTWAVTSAFDYSDYQASKTHATATPKAAAKASPVSTVAASKTASPTVAPSKTPSVLKYTPADALALLKSIYGDGNQPNKNYTSTEAYKNDIDPSYYNFLMANANGGDPLTCAQNWPPVSMSYDTPSQPDEANANYNSGIVTHQHWASSDEAVYVAVDLRTLKIVGVTCNYVKP